MFSKRKYRVLGFVGDITPFNWEFNVNTLLTEDKDGYEYLYALQEETDLILDLQVNETMFVSLARDNTDYKGVLIRVS